MGAAGSRRVAPLQAGPGCAILRRVSSPEELWLDYGPHASAGAEADAQTALVAAARSGAASGARRLWLCAPGAFHSPYESLRLALVVALACEPLRVVAAGLRVRHWIRFAEDVATADGVCGGRLELAFADVPEVELLERLRQAWSGAPVTVVEPERVQIHPRPVRPDGPPLWAFVATEAAAVAAAKAELGAVAQDAETLVAHAAAARPPLPAALRVPPGTEAPSGLPSHAVVIAASGHEPSPTAPRA